MTLKITPEQQPLPEHLRERMLGQFDIALQHGSRERAIAVVDAGFNDWREWQQEQADITSGKAPANDRHIDSLFYSEKACHLLRTMEIENAGDVRALLARLLEENVPGMGPKAAGHIVLTICGIYE